MDTEADFQFRPRTGKAASAPLLPEVEAYLQLLVVIFLMNSKRYKEVLISQGDPVAQALPGVCGRDRLS